MEAYGAINACPIRKQDIYSMGRWTYGSWMWCPNITKNLRQGTWYNSALIRDEKGEGEYTQLNYYDYYSVMVFDNAAIQAQYATHFPTAARLRLMRTASGAPDSARTMGLYAGNQTGIPAVDDNGSKAATVPSPVTGRYDYSISGGQNEKVIDIALALAESICTGASNCLYMFVGRDTGKYMSFVGRDDLAKVVLEIDWQPRQPAPTTPSNPTVTSPITGASPTLSWGASSDHMFPANQLTYEVELSFNGGSTWGNLHTTAAGVTSYAPNLKTILGLEVGQYYHNTQFRFRVRSKTPLWPDAGGGHYYSPWAQTANRTIDYRIVPSAPGITPSVSDPYEGQAMHFSMTRPVSYNTHRANGAAMELNHRVYLDGAQVEAQTQGVGTASFNLLHTVGNLTTGVTDRTMALTARCVDSEGQTGTLSASQDMTIRRYRAPVVAVTDTVRAAESVDVKILIQDTGFSTPQSNEQVRKIQVSLGFDWTDVTLGAWDGLQNAFTIAGLDPDTRYELQVRAVNVAPSGMSDKTGAPYNITVLEFSPAAFPFKQIETGVTGFATKSLIVAKDPIPYKDEIEEDNAIVAGNLDVGGEITQNGEPISALPEGGTTGQALVKVSDDDGDVAWDDVGRVSGPASSGDGNIAVFDGAEGKNIADSGIPASGLTRKLASIVVKGSNATYVEFTNLDFSQTGPWRMVLKYIGTDTVIDGSIYVNGETTGNGYNCAQVRDGSNYTYSNQAYVGYAGANNELSVSDILIYYDAETNSLAMVGTGIRRANTSNMASALYTVRKTGTGNITSLRVYASKANGFKIGSKFDLYSLA